MLASDNFGASWWQTGSFEGFNECNLVEEANGDVYLNSRNQPGPTRCFNASFSNCQCKLGVRSQTAGDSWGDVFAVPSLPDPICQGCMIRQKLDGGARWLFSGPDQFSTECTKGSGADHCAGDGDSQHGRCCLSVWHSENGRNWSAPPILVDSGTAAYSSVIPLTLASSVAPEVGVLYEKSAAGCVGASCRICFARVPLTLKSDDSTVHAGDGWQIDGADDGGSDSDVDAPPGFHITGHAPVLVAKSVVKPHSLLRDGEFVYFPQTLHHVGVNNSALLLGFQTVKDALHDGGT